MYFKRPLKARSDLHAVHGGWCGFEREFVGGGLADMGGHHFDIAQWAIGMDGSGPMQIEPPGGNANARLKLTRANGTVMFQGASEVARSTNRREHSCVDCGKLEADPAKILDATIGPNDVRCELSDNHHRNWLDAVRSRQKPISDFEIGDLIVGVRDAKVCGPATRR